MASLLTLPQELIAHIAQILYARTPHRGDEPVLGPDRLAVSQLSKTCRLLRDVGQAELFTSIECQGNLVGAIRLIRALISRPELGVRVREIAVSDVMTDGPRHPDTADDKWLVTADDAAVLNKALRRFNVRSLTNEAGEETEDGVPLAFQAITKASQNMSFQHGALAALAILHSPNVDHVALHAHNWTLPHFATPAGTFDSLVDITLEPGPLGESTTVDASLGWLMSAAPNLRRFCGVMVSRVEGGYSHKGIIDIIMRYSSLSSDCFSTMVEIFPNMASFTYAADTLSTWSSYSEATPSEVIDAMLPLKDKLTSLTLDWNYSPAAESNEWDRDEMSLSKLSQMTALSHLSITARDVVCDDPSDDSDIEIEEEVEDEAEDSHVHDMKVKVVRPIKESPHVAFLRSIMAPNLEILHLSSVPRGFSIMPFANIAAISYPNLKTIYMGDYSDSLISDKDVIKAYFKVKGINIERESDIMGKLRCLYSLI